MAKSGKVLGFWFLVGAALFVTGAARSGAAEPKPIRVGHLGEWTGPAGRTCGPPGDALIAYFNEYVNKEKGGIPYLNPKTGEVQGKVKVEMLYADCRYELPLFKSAYRDFLDGTGNVTRSSGIDKTIPIEDKRPSTDSSRKKTDGH